MAAPKLRFKEFDADWLLGSVGQYLIEFKQKVPSTTDIEVYSSSREGLKPQKDYFDNRELQNFGEYGVVPRNYITYRHMSDDTTFKFNINKVGKEIAVSKEYPVFTTNKDLDIEFLLLKLNESNDFKKFAIEQKKGGTRTRLYFKALCTWETLLPFKEEQTKIASFLSAVDEKISQLTQKHALLSQYKQGMMQKLFSQKIRFKADDGSEFGEWEEKLLKEYFPKIRNGFVGVATPYYVESGVKYLQGKNIKNGKIDATGLIYINNEFHQKKTNSILHTNDILMVQSGHVGECAVVTNDYENGNCHALLVLTPKSSQIVNSEFVVYYFYSEFGKKKINLIKTGNTIEHILASDIKEVSMLFPCIEEQTKIANLLSAIDQKIEVVAQQIEQAKHWKKGLLQQMFV